MVKLSGLIGNAGLVDNAVLYEKVGFILIEGEELICGYQLIRDFFVFTNKRLILIDKQGLTGKKVDYHSVLYKAISRFSLETAGPLDLDAELKIWISSTIEPVIEKRFNRKVNIYSLQKVLATFILN